MATDPQNPFLELAPPDEEEERRASRPQGDNPFAGLGGGTATAEAEPAAEPVEASGGGEGPGLLSRAWGAVREGVGDLLERETGPEFPYAPEGYTPPVRDEPLPEPGTYPATPHRDDPHGPARAREAAPPVEPEPEQLRGSELAAALEEHTEGRARGPVHDLTREEQAQAQVAQTRYERGTQREAEAREAREYAAGKTPGERLVNAGSSFMQSAVGMGASSLQGLASLAKDLDELTGTGEYEGMEADELQLAQWGDRLQEWAEETFPDDPEMRGAFLENVLPSAVGSAATFLALGAGGRAAGAPGYVTAGTAGALAEAGGQYEEAEAAGAPEEERRLAARLALPLGALEALPVERQLGRLFSGGGSLSRVAREALIGGLEEGFQEGAQGVGGNIIAGELYDPERLAFEGVPESMLAGMLTGAGLSAGATGAGNLMADPADAYVSYHRELERKYGENLWGMNEAEARRLGRLAGRVAARDGGETAPVEARPREQIPGVHTPEEQGEQEALDRFSEQEEPATARSSVDVAEEIIEREGVGPSQYPDAVGVAEAAGRREAARREEIDQAEVEAPAEEPSAEPVEAGIPEPGEAMEMPVEAIAADPQRFQFKMDTDEQGVTEELKGVEKWDPNLAGVIQVWQDPEDGQFYVVNGHHRLELAKRLGVEGILARHIDAPDAGRARTIGAMTNIAEGRGTPIDAAKLFRDADMTEEELEAAGISLKGATARDGLALSRLPEELFQKVATRQVPYRRAAVVGASGLATEQQRALWELVEEEEAGGNRLTNAEIEELARFVEGAETVDVSQETLFGEETTSQSTALQKAEVSAYVKKQLKREKNLFGYVSRGRRAQEIEEAGAGEIDVERSEEIATSAEQAVEVYEKLSTMAGPVSEALNQAARELASDEADAATVKQNALENVREAIGELTGKLQRATGPELDLGADMVALSPDEDVRPELQEVRRIIESGALQAPGDQEGQSEGTPSSRSLASEAGGEESTVERSPPRFQPRSGPDQVSDQTRSPSFMARSTTPPSETGPAYSSGASRIGAIEPSSGRKILQAYGDFKSILGRSEELIEPFMDALKDAAAAVSGAARFNGARVKGMERIIEKVEEGRPPETMGDYLGGRIALDRVEDADAILAELEGRGWAVIPGEDEAFFDNDSRGGYRARHVQLLAPDGDLAVELQLAPREIQEVQDEAHDYYDIVRGSVEASLEEVEEARRRVREIFDGAWRKYIERTGADPVTGRQEGRFRARGQDDAALAPERDLFGQEVTPEPEGPDQGELGIQEEAGETLTGAVQKARTTISLLQGKEDRGMTSKAESRMLAEAKQLLRREEGIDADELRSRSRALEEEEKRPTYGDTGELFLAPEEGPDLTLDQLQTRLERRYPGATVRLYEASHDPSLVELFNIEVAEDQRGQGVGTRAMNEVIAWADANNKTLWLQVKEDGPTPAEDLVRWYKGLGFVENRGRTADHALTVRAQMYRPPAAGDVTPLESGWDDAYLASERLQDAGRFRTASEEEVEGFVSRESDAAVPSRAEIQKELEEALGLVVKEGRFPRASPEGALGLYKSRPESIHLGTYGDITTLAHEVGHHVQKLFFESPDGRLYDEHLTLLPEDLQDELLELGRGISGGGLTEGWAEFWRRYMDNPESLPRQAPSLLGYIQERLDNEFPRIRDALEHGARQWRLHREGGELARLESQISVGERGPGRSAKESWNDIRTGLLDRFDPVRRAVQQLTDGRPVVSEDAEMLARLSGGSSGIAEHFLEYGQIDYATQEVIGPALREVLEPVANNLDNFRTYAVARRAEELHDRDIETGMRHADVMASIDQLEDRFGESFRPAFDALVAYQDSLLRYLVDAGVMSEETYQAIKDKNQAYVPFFRVMDQQGASGISGAFGHLFTPVRKIEGSGRQIVDPLESIVQNTYQYAQLAAKQEVSRALGRLAERQGAASQLEAVETPIRRVQFSLGEIEDQLKEIVGEEAIEEIRERHRKVFEAATADLTPEEIRERGLKPYDPAEELMAIFRPGDLFNKANVISVLEDGQRRYYEVNNELWEALQGIDTEQAPLVARWLGIPARTLRAGATLAPEFQLRNPIRDQAMAAIQSEYGYTPYVDLAKGMFHILGRTDLYKKWKLSGGDRSSLLALDRREMQRSVEQLTRSGGVENVIKTQLDALRLFGRATAELATLNLRGAAESSIEGVQAALDPLARISALMEDATRVGEFANALEVEGDTKEGRQLAGYASREISIDFNRHGSKTAALRIMSAFWNARLQGYDRLARAAKNNPARFAGKAFVYITLPSLIELAVNWDDEEYWEQPQWQRDLFWMFKVGGTWVRIPKPFELGLVFGTFPQRIAEWVFREDPTGVEKFLSETAPKELEGMVPAPTALMPLIENTVNYSFFLDRPIVPRSEEGAAPRFQYNERTSEVARAIGQWTGSSPRKIDNLLYAWSGGLGRLATGTVDRALEATGARTPTEAEGIPGIPGIRGVTARDPGFSSESIERFYRRRGEATQALETRRFLEREDRNEELDEFLEDPENSRQMRLVHIPGPAKGIYERTASQLADLRARAERIRRDEDLTPEEKKERIDELGLQARQLARRALERSRRE